MILPIGDQPNPRGFTPYVNYALIAVNVLVFILISVPLMSQSVDVNDPALREYLQELLRNHPELELIGLHNAIKHVAAYDLFVMQWGYRPAEPSLITLFASMFLHGGWLHLIGNMLFLWIYGDNVEHRLGRLGYLLAYLGTGALGTLSFGAFVSASAGNVPLVGASGAISGVLGLYFIWFPRNKVRLLVLLFPFFFNVWHVGARLVLGFYLIVDNLLPFIVQRGQSSGVAHGAHIGGFVAGFAIAFVLDHLSSQRGSRRARRPRPKRDSRPDHQVREFSSGSAATRSSAAGGSGIRSSLFEAYERGDYGAAVIAYLNLTAAQRQPVPASVAADLGDWLAENDETDGALAVYRRALGDRPRDPDTSRLYLGIGLALLRGKKRPTAAYQYLLDVLDTRPTAETERTARDAIAEIENMQKLRFGSRN